MLFLKIEIDTSDLPFFVADGSLVVGMLLSFILAVLFASLKEDDEDEEMTYKQEMKFIATQIVKSKGHHVFLDWSKEKKDVFDLVSSLNDKINKTPRVNKVETTVESLFTQPQFEF